MTRPTLLVQCHDTSRATFDVYKQVNGLSELIFSYGNNSGFPVGSFNFTNICNLAVHWNDAIYAVAGEDGIYKWDEATGSVTKVHTFASPATGVTSNGQIGLYSMVRGGKNVLVTAYVNTSDGITAVALDEQDNGTEGTPSSFSSGTAERWSYSIIKWGNKLYSCAHAGGFIFFIIDAETLSVSATLYSSGPLFGLSQGYVGLVPSSGSLYGCRVSVDRISTLTFVRFDGVTPVSMGPTWGDGVESEVLNSHYHGAVWEHDGVIYAMAPRSSSSNTFGLYKINQNADGTLAGVPQEIANTVFGFNTSPAVSYDKIYVYKDVETTTGKSRTILLCKFGSSGPFNQYEFNGPDKAATFLGSVGDGDLWCGLRDKVGGGEYSFSGSGEYNWRFVGSRVNGTIVEIDQVLYGNSGGNTVNMDMRFDLNGGPPTTQATLISTTSGTLNGNVVEGLIPEGSGTIITTAWAAASDGIVGGSVPSICGRIFN